MPPGILVAEQLDALMRQIVTAGDDSASRSGLAEPGLSGFTVTGSPGDG
ncbi:hypothetical protein QS306_06330 [Paraburkholderia bonniea]|nr:hypothetical protein [Paraburkholderia bonniea]WJF91246.1 hypothetical protein QS306_06330 [Paraburkholderia bonniea]WJF94561.1 hypothetical protein QS308_06340 [Paraburkholderia bonniea]